MDEAIKQALQTAINQSADRYDALVEAVASAGSVQTLADAMTRAGVETSRYQIYRWLRSAEVPAERCALLEEITGVARARLRPDLWGDA